MRKLRIGSLMIVLLLWLMGGALVAQEQPSLYTLPDSRARITSSSSMVQAGDGLMIAVNMLNNSVTFVDLYAADRLREVAVGTDPRTVALTPDGTRVVVANRGSGDISVLSLRDRVVTASFPVGQLPYAVVMLDDNRALVTLQATDEVVMLDLTSGRIVQRIATPPGPAGLTLWGSTHLYVTHLWSGLFSMIFLPQGVVVRSIPTGGDTALSQFALIDAGRGLAYLPQTRLNAQNPTPTFDTTAFPVVNVIDLRGMTLERRARVALDIAGGPVNMPFAAVLDSARRWLYVANAGSDNVSIIDLTTNLAVGSFRTGANPRALLLSRDAGTLYVHNMIDSTLMFFNISNRSLTNIIPLSELNIAADVQLGAQIFHSASRQMTADNWLSCATCHFDGQSDGRVWQGMPGGPRNTPTLYNLADRAPYNAAGTWDELADVELKIRALQAGSGLINGQPHPALAAPNAGRSLDLDNLTAYLFSLQGPAAPPVSAPEQVERGGELFMGLGCIACHSGEVGADGQRYDVGTGGAFVTPPLRWLWQSAPYLHDGRAATLHDLFIMPGGHQLIRDNPPEDIDALVAYLLSR